MTIEKSIVDRIAALIEEGRPISPAGKKGYALLATEEDRIAGWLTSANHMVDLVISTSGNAYQNQCARMNAKFSTACAMTHQAGRRKSECIGEMVSILENLLRDIDAGLISSLEDRVHAEAFDNFLDHAEPYLKKGRYKESGVIVGVVFEDAIRRIGQNNGITGRKIEDIINNLAKRDILTSTKVKRAKAAANVRTKASHADWKEFDITDVKEAMGFTRELVGQYLDE